MNTQTNRRRRRALLTGFATIILLCSAFNLTFAQAGAKFGARDPHVCEDRTQPKTGGPSAAQAKEYFLCDYEHASDERYSLVEDVKVQVGPGRPYNPHDVNFPNIDIKYPVYPIRGSFTSYVCGSIYLDKSNLGRNCNTYAQPNAVGACYKDMFGDWHCGMADTRTSHDVASNVAPPGGPAQKNNPAQKTPPNNQVQNEKPADDNKQEEQNDRREQKNADDQNAGGFPKPDFSAISDTYDLIRYEYNSRPGWLSFTVKVKKETSPVTSNYTVHFLDEDGAEVFAVQPTLGGWGHPGDVLHFEVAMPFKRDMQKVKKVVLRQD